MTCIMNMHTKHELTGEISGRYIISKRKEKKQILDEYCKTTGYNRKYAIEKLRSFGLQPKKKEQTPGQHRRQRERFYDMKVEEALHTIWEVYDYICAERMHPNLDEMIDKLFTCGELDTDPLTEIKLRKISLGTLKRLLKRIRVRETNRIQGTTKPGILLKSEIPLRVGEWRETDPGFLEIDTVAHCGDSVAGMYVNTLSATDIATGWFEGRAVLGKAQERIFEALQDIRLNLPFPLLGLDSDNGYEFINWEMFKYCKKEKIVFTRSRPYKKNDNAHIEQKNWTCVRRIFGYQRIEEEEKVKLMNDLFKEPLGNYINFFLPSVKCIEKKRIGSRIVKKYDQARTPFERVCQSGKISEETKQTLRQKYQNLNPVALRKEIAKLKKKLFTKNPSRSSMNYGQVIK